MLYFLNKNNIFDTEIVKQQLIDYCEMDALTTFQLYAYLKQKV